MSGGIEGGRPHVESTLQQPKQPEQTQKSPEAGAGPLGLPPPDAERPLYSGAPKSPGLDLRGQAEEAAPAQRGSDRTNVQARIKDRIVIKDTSPRRPLIRDTSPVRPPIDPEIVRKALGAEEIHQETYLSGSPLILQELRKEIVHRLKSKGGRPSLEGTDHRVKIPVAEEDWKQLGEIAKSLSAPGHVVSTGQFASALLHNKDNRDKVNAQRRRRYKERKEQGKLPPRKHQPKQVYPSPTQE